uniref:OSIGBa0101A01.7 protein n=1 Tax=Oryza sativa TaxID=4530 RepID=Q01LW4_ORYSA|nr:OSIGBa0101A01.7 [Oryza sativa]
MSPEQYWRSILPDTPMPISISNLWQWLPLLTSCWITEAWRR